MGLRRRVDNCEFSVMRVLIDHEDLAFKCRRLTDQIDNLKDALRSLKGLMAERGWEQCRVCGRFYPSAMTKIGIDSLVVSCKCGADIPQVKAKKKG